MDSVYSVYDAIASPKIDIAKYFEQYHQVVSEELFKPSQNNEARSIANFMPSSLEEEELDLLAKYCSPDKLKVPGELDKSDKAQIIKKGPWSLESTGIPKETGLATLSKLEDTYKTQNLENIKSLRKYIGEIQIEFDKSEVSGPLAIPGKDVIVYIRVYEPFTARPTSTTGKRIVMSSVIAILGSQTLDKVRDLVECISDLSVSKEVSENPDAPSEPCAKDIYKSGFFYIEGTFYNDFRDKGNRDNSRIIREWAKSHNLGPFKTATMEDVRIDSLSLRFGYPWVYQHQGNCEHLIVFSDARLVSVDDELTISAYPRIHRLKQRRSRCCMMCGLFAVRWVTTDSNRIPHNPCYLCGVCFKSYNYIDGKKIGNFKAYRYPHDPELERDVPSSAKTSKSTKLKEKFNKT